MGRHKKKKFRGGRDKVWHDITKHNEMFEKYYKAQNIIPEEKWGEFMETFRRELPSTIRITGTRRQSKLLLDFLRRTYLDNMSDLVIQDEKVEPPKMLSWYPDELAWQVNLTRKFLRKSATMEKFHFFLVQETECGNISRQEAVSMIPPLLLDVKPGHKVLDTCAAPGSKTSQIIEMLHTDDTKGLPDGLVIANELQNKRCYMLIHQSKRLRSPSCLVTNHDASVFPTLFITNKDGNKVPLKFDRILCDVPCSGDGTLRKNTLIWNKWSPQTGLSLHRIQLRILARAVEMLEVGGRIVYSTCSLNPVENEAVVAQLVKNSNGAVELLDVSNSLPDLKRSPGLFTWKLMMKSGEEVTSCDPGSDAYKGCFRLSHFPPPLHEAKSMNLDRCIRVYPHQQDTGGFFIAVLVKKTNAPWENENRFNSNPKWLPWQTEGEGQPRNKQLVGTDSEAHPDQANSIVKTENADAVDCESNVTHGLPEDIDDGQQIEDDEVGDEANVNNMEVTNEGNDGDGGDDPDGGGAGAAVRINQELKTEGGDKSISLQPPRKKQKLDLGFKEDPFILLSRNDEQWQQIQEYFGIEASFPCDQLLVRSVGGKKRNIYLVSKLVKQVLENADDNLKIINVGVKTFGRCDSEENGCEFRIMQEGIDSVFQYVTKRKIHITEQDVSIFLQHDKPFTNKLSESTRKQLTSVKGLGCVVFIYEPKGKYSSPSDTLDCELHFCGWKAKTSTRILASQMDKTHYKVVCGISPVKDLTSAKCLLDKDEDKVPNNKDFGFI